MTHSQSGELDHGPKARRLRAQDPGPTPPGGSQVLNHVRFAPSPKSPGRSAAFIKGRCGNPRALVTHYILLNADITNPPEQAKGAKSPKGRDGQTGASLMPQPLLSGWQLHRSLGRPNPPPPPRWPWIKAWVCFLAQLARLLKTSCGKALLTLMATPGASKGPIVGCFTRKVPPSTASSDLMWPRRETVGIPPRNLGGFVVSPPPGPTASAATSAPALKLAQSQGH